MIEALSIFATWYAVIAFIYWKNEDEDVAIALTWPIWVYVEVRERWREHEHVLSQPFCENENDTFICNLDYGHSGDHQHLHPSGGSIGWRNND